MVEQCEGDFFDFILRETTTAEIIDDVRSFRSEVGILYLDAFNQRVMQKAFDDADVSFYPLFDAGVHVFVGENHPLAGRDIIKPEELTVWPRYSFEQGTANSFYYFRGAAELRRALAQYPHLRPRHAFQPADQLQRLHAFHGRAFKRNAYGHRQHPA